MNEAIYTIDLLQPSSTVHSGSTELQRVAGILNYPIVIRPSKDSNNQMLKIISNPDELLVYLNESIVFS